MKNSTFYIFFTIALILYFSINLYIVLRGLHALPRGGWYRPIFLLVMMLLILSYPAGRLLEGLLFRGSLDFLIHIGAYYLAMMVFAFFLILIIDLLRLGNAVFHYFPASWQQAGSSVFLIVAGIVLVLTLVGSWNARHPRIRKMELTIQKPSHSLNQLSLVLVSDLHLGTLVQGSRLDKMINRLQPDVVLLMGDIFDEDINALMEQNIASNLSRLKGRYGVFAIPGNHEYYSGVESALTYMRQAGITVLRDSVVKIADSFYLVGRDDRTLNRFGGKRKSLQQLLKNVDREYPIILMDHQPFHLEEAVQNHVDLQVSGHTHHGQIFPFNLITGWVYEVSWGYLRKGNTHFYVSCGVGTWGPPVRLGNVPEIVKLNLKMHKSQKDPSEK